MRLDHASSTTAASHALLADRHALGLELGVNARRAIGLVRGAMDHADLPDEIDVSRSQQ